MYVNFHYFHKPTLCNWQIINLWLTLGYYLIRLALNDSWYFVILTILHFSHI